MDTTRCCPEYPQPKYYSLSQHSTLILPYIPNDDNDDDDDDDDGGGAKMRVKTSGQSDILARDILDS